MGGRFRLYRLGGPQIASFSWNTVRELLDVGEDSVEPATFWTMISAIATAVSAVVIAWQSVLTRWSVKQAERSADASERAVAAATESLELARAQAQHSELMSAEAIRSRMEADAPAVFLAFSDSDENGPKAFAYARADSYDAPFLNQVETGETFWDVRDDESWLFAIFRVRLENAGSRPIVIDPGVAFGYFPNRTLSDRLHQVRISGNSSLSFFLAVGARVSEWISATHAEDRQRAVPAMSAWSIDVEGETGVLVRQILRIQGTLLESGPGKGAYTLRSLGPDPSWNYPSRLLVDKQKRDYIVGRDELGYPRMLPAPDITGARS